MSSLDSSRGLDTSAIIDTLSIFSRAALARRPTAWDAGGMAKRLAKLVALLSVAFAAAPVRCDDRPPDEANAAAERVSAAAETLEDAAARLKAIEGVAVDLRRLKAGSRSDSRRQIGIEFPNWDRTPVRMFVFPSLPTDKIGERP